MLIPVAILRRVVAGEVDLQFRAWKRPTVKAGGTLHTTVGLLAIESVDRVDDITDAEAVRAGHLDAAAARAMLRRGEGRALYRVAVRYAGPDPRKALRADDDLDQADRDALNAKLDRLDARSPHGPWTRQVLALIAESPGTRAPDLAMVMGLEKKRFKSAVRQLKALGLTESLRVGYRLSPRGRALLGAP